MFETIVLGIISFVGTNVDDMFITTLFFAEAETKKEYRKIILGKYLGIGFLVFVSLLAAWGLQILPQKYIGLLGLVPVYLGVKESILNVKNPSSEEEHVKKGASGFVFQVMLVTIANGADNIGVYMPLFAGFEWWQLLVVISIFMVMNAVWCFIGKKISDLPILRKWILRYKTVIIPVVYIALGLYIILKANL